MEYKMSLDEALDKIIDPSRGTAFSISDLDWYIVKEMVFAAKTLGVHDDIGLFEASKTICKYYLPDCCNYAIDDVWDHYWDTREGGYNGN